MNDDQLSGDEQATNDIAARIERLGDQPVDVSADRLDAIEARVRTSIEQNESDEHRSAVAVIVAGQSTGITRSSSTWSRVALVAASVAVLVALSVAVFGTRDDTLVVVAANDVVVLLPDGDSFMAADGTELPEDSVLDVSGFVEVGGRRYGPGRYRVEDGRLVPIADDPPQVVSDTTEDTVPVPSESEQPRPTSPITTSPNTTARPPVSSAAITTGPPPTRPATPQPPVTRPATTTPPRTTVPDRTVPQRPTTTVPLPTTTGPPITRAPTSEPGSTAVRPTTSSTTSTTTTSTTTTSTTTTTPVVRDRPSADEPVRES